MPIAKPYGSRTVCRPAFTPVTLNAMPVFSGLSLRAAVELVATGQASSSELVDAALADAAANDGLGAFVALDGDRARMEARRPHPAPLRGIPIAVKDMVDVAGLPTRAGTTASRSRPARVDASIVKRLRRAGAIVIGKTATHELAYGTVTPGVVNPRFPDLIAGGSSGGSAAAVAAGVVPLALGTDTAGSVRIPSACCGVSGLVAAPGRLPMRGVTALSPSFDTLGPIAAGPRDLALAWAALEGTRAARLTGRLRAVGVPSAELLGRVDADALTFVGEVARHLGVPVERVGHSGDRGLPAFSQWASFRAIVIGAEALETHRSLGLYPERRDQLGAETREQDDAASRRTNEEVRDAQASLRALGARLRAAVKPGTVLLTPALPTPPPRRDAVAEPAAGRLTRFVAPVNASGLAAAVVPIGPCGVQLIAREVPTLLAALDRL